MAGHTLVDALVISGRRWRHKAQTVDAQLRNGGVDVAAAAGDVLNAFAFVAVQVLYDLASLVRGFVDRNADLAIRAGQRPGEQTRILSFDIKVANLSEVKEAFVETGPDIHASATHIVRQVVDVVEAVAFRLWIARPEPVESVVVDRALVAIAIDQVQQT